MREINRIIIHCAWTPQEMDIGAAEIRRWHIEGNKWRDIGYHYVIRRDGTVEDGRPIEQIGAHVAHNNHDSIGICLIGGKRGRDTDFNFTRHQLRGLENLVLRLLDRFPRASVTGHRDWAQKECPGFDVRAWWYGRV